MYANRGIQAYKKDSMKSDLAGADPHRIIQLLMQGALDRLALGKGCIERRDLEGKAKFLSRSIEIIHALKDSLDRTYNPELADNLDSLYDYMTYRITEASSKLDNSMIDEVIGLLLQIKGAWDQISMEDKQNAYITKENERLNGA